jgi:hypothetical protein
MGDGVESPQSTTIQIDSSIESRCPKYTWTDDFCGRPQLSKISLFRLFLRTLDVLRLPREPYVSNSLCVFSDMDDIRAGGFGHIMNTSTRLGRIKQQSYYSRQTELLSPAGSEAGLNGRVLMLRRSCTHRLRIA